MSKLARINIDIKVAATKNTQLRPDCSAMSSANYPRTIEYEYLRLLT
jgi:hypothetical protein